MKKLVLLAAIGAVVMWTASPVFAQPWADDFDGYPTGVSLHGLGGWLGWGNNPAATAFTDNTVFSSAPNSVNISGGTDLVQEFSTPGTGVYTMTADSYFPTGATGVHHFIMLNTFDHFNPAVWNWSTQTAFDHTTQMVSTTGGGGAPFGTSVNIPIVYDQWIPIQVDINLNFDRVSITYNGAQSIFAENWSQTGAVDIGALDLYSGTGTASDGYFDNINLTPEPAALSFLALGGLVLLRRRR